MKVDQSSESIANYRVQCSRGRRHDGRSLVYHAEDIVERARRSAHRRPLRSRVNQASRYTRSVPYGRHARHASHKSSTSSARLCLVFSHGPGHAHSLHTTCNCFPYMAVVHYDTSEQSGACLSMAHLPGPPSHRYDHVSGNDHSTLMNRMLISSQKYVPRGRRTTCVGGTGTTTLHHRQRPVTARRSR